MEVTAPPLVQVMLPLLTAPELAAEPMGQTRLRALEVVARALGAYLAPLAAGADFTLTWWQVLRVFERFHGTASPPARSTVEASLRGVLARMLAHAPLDPAAAENDALWASTWRTVAAFCPVLAEQLGGVEPGPGPGPGGAGGDGGAAAGDGAGAGAGAGGDGAGAGGAGAGVGGAGAGA